MESPFPQQPSPNGHEPDDYAQNDVQQANANLAILNGTERLILEGRKRRVDSDKSDRDEIPPVRTGGGPRQQSQYEPNQEPTRDVDDEGSIRKAASVPLTDVASSKYRKIPRLPPMAIATYLSNSVLSCLRVLLQQLF